MGKKRKMFCNLTERAKRRRLQVGLQEEKNKNSVQQSKSLEHCEIGCKSSTSSTPFDDDLSNVQESSLSSVSFIDTFPYYSSNENLLNLSDEIAVDEVQSDSGIPPTSRTSEACESCTLDLKELLAKWMQSEKSIPHDAFTRLLKVLREKFPMLPSSSKTILPYVKNRIIPMFHGEYLHFSNWEQGLINALNANHLLQVKEINLLMNVDGIPMFPNSVKYTSYPLLLKIMEIPSKIFIVGVYCSNKTKNTSMPPADILLEQFLLDLDNMSNGILTDHGPVKVKLRAFVCDAPVRASLKCIISHSGYHSCERCVQHGEYHHSVVMPRTDCEERSDETFLLKVDPLHHKGISPLESIGFPMVSGFIVDYMHCACIGVMKRILIRLKSSTKNQLKVHLSVKQKLKFNKNLDMVRQSIPSDFARRLEGGIENINHWKATEMRAFLLYIGIALFGTKKIISKEFRLNFLHFSVAMKLLLTDHQHCNLKVIQSLMIQFVSDAADLYGISFVSYNVHNLIHLHQDYKEYGNLNLVSTFPFESFLGTQIKGSVTAGFKPLQQLSHHLGQFNVKVPEVHVSNYTEAYRRIKNCQHQYPGDCYKNLTVKQNLSVKVSSSLNGRDSYIQTVSGDIGIINGIHHENGHYCIFIQLMEKTDLFTEPIASSSVGVYKVKQLDSHMWVKSEDIFCKLIVLPYRKSLLAQVLMHSSTTSETADNLYDH